METSGTASARWKTLLQTAMVMHLLKSEGRWYDRYS